MGDSLGSLDNPSADNRKHDGAAQAYPHSPRSYTHLFALNGQQYSQVKERPTTGLLPRRIAPLHPIPPEVLLQLEKLIDEAIQSMVNGKEPPILSPMIWDAILILRRTGIRCSELLSLEAPPQRCLEQDTSGSWWLLVKPKGLKTIDDYRRVPIQMDSGVIEAIHRQRQRIINIPDPLNEGYLFRHRQELLTSTAMRVALRKLGSYLTYDGQPYVIAAIQFRHTIAHEILEHDSKLSVLLKFMGHTSPSKSMDRTSSSQDCQYYFHPQLDSLSKQLEQFRERLHKFQNAEEQSGVEHEQRGKEQEGKEE